MMTEYKNYMMHDALDDEVEIQNDPLFFAQVLRDSTVMGLKSALMQSFDNRKKKIMPYAIEIFNRITEKNVVQQRKLDISDNPKHVDQNIATFETLLNDSRSPIVPHIKDTARYADYPIRETFEEWRLSRDRAETVDIVAVERDLEKLLKARIEVGNILEKIIGHDEHLSAPRDEKPLSELYDFYVKDN